jgi:arylsulfatase A-like enzyme
MKSFSIKISFLLLSFLTGCVLLRAQQNQKPPNILIILSDDHAYQAISAYGSKLMQTPNIDRIAKEGVIFQNACVTNSLCGPSRAALLTGKYSHVNGLKINNFSNPFNVKQEVFSRLLKQKNYQTAWIGKWHLQTLPGDAFDYWNVLPDQGNYYNPDFISMTNDTTRINGYITDIISSLSFDWLSKRDTSKPFCLVIGEKATHRAWLPDLQDLGAFDDQHFPLPSNFYDDYKDRIAAKNQDMTVAKTMLLGEDLKVHADYQDNGFYKRLNPEQLSVFKTYYEKLSKDFDSHHYTGRALTEWKYQRYLKDYLSTAKSLDRNIGKILDYLDKNGLTENTVVIYASDQGFYMGEHGWFDKRFIYEESMKTPVVMRYPGVVKPGTSVDQMIMNIDFAPTVLSIAGVAVPASIQGASFLPLLQGGNVENWRKAAYYHYYEFPEPHHVSPHFGMRTDQYKLVRFYGPADAWELYDLKKDPMEMHNLYSQQKDGKLMASLKNELKALISQYHDDEAMSILAKETH